MDPLTAEEELKMKEIMADFGQQTLMNVLVANLSYLKSAGAPSITQTINKLQLKANELQSHIDGLEAAKLAREADLTAQKNLLLSIKAKLEAP